MPSALVHNETLDRLIRTGGWADLAEGTPRLIERALAAEDHATAAALIDFFKGEMRVVFDIDEQWFRDTRRYLTDNGMTEADLDAAHASIRDTLAPYQTNVHQPRQQVWAAVETALACARDGTLPEAACLAALADATGLWRDLHDGEVDQLSGLFHLVTARKSETALREMYEGWVIGDWFAKRYQRFDASRIDWETASWLLVYLGFEGHHGHLSGTARDGSIAFVEDAEKITLSFAPCGSGGRSMAGEARDGMPALGSPAIGWPELQGRHDFTWNETGICAYCAHCCILHENLPIAAFGYPVRVTTPPVAPLSGESRCSWTIYKNLRDIPEAAYTRVGAVKPAADAPLGSAGRQARADAGATNG
jgi:hypothetical protein